jgi:hypothetical protein
MRQVREILRLKYEQHLAHRAIARACGVGLGTVSEYCRRARQASLTWPLPAESDDAQLEARFFRQRERRRGRALAAAGHGLDPSGAQAGSVWT